MDKYAMIETFTEFLKDMDFNDYAEMTEKENDCLIDFFGWLESAKNNEYNADFWRVGWSMLEMLADRIQREL